MQARPSAFFHQVSRASRMRVPRAWMAKSTSVVVPPKAAARVPVSKSSLDVVPPKGMSRCVWASMPPGRRSMPVASSVLWEAAGIPARTSLMVWPSMRTSAGKVFSAVTTVPFWRRSPISEPRSVSLRIAGCAAGTLLPGLRRKMCINFFHGDATLDGADEGAEVAADTFGFVHAGDARERGGVWLAVCRRGLAVAGSGGTIELGDGRDRDGLPGALFEHGGCGVACLRRQAVGRARDAIHVNALVGTIPAGGVAEGAADAFFLVDAGDDLVVEVEVLPLLNARKREAAKIIDARETFSAHPVGEAVGHVLDDAIAVMHDGGADLDGGAAEKEEFGGVAPVGDAADAGKRKSGIRIALNLLAEMEGNGLDGGTAVTAVGGFAVNVGARREGVEIDSGDGVDGVDGGEAVGAAAFCGSGDGTNVGDVRSELDEDGRAGFLLDPGGDHFGVVGDLADGGAHAAFAHPVRAAEVEFEAVGAGILGLLHDFVPGFALGFDHEGSDDGVPGIAFLYFGDFAKVDVERAVGDELDVVEAHHALAVEIDGGIARRDVDDGLAEGFPDGAAPAGVESAHDLFAAIGGRSGGEPEGIGGMDFSSEEDREVGIAAGGVVNHGRTPERKAASSRRTPKVGVLRRMNSLCLRQTDSG